ncbi:hypothetical protein WJX77_005756 [Trebouxia sp. C0004]
MKRVNVNTREQMPKADVIDLTKGAPQPSRALSVPHQTSSMPDCGVIDLSDSDSDSAASASNSPQQAPRFVPPALLPASHQTGHCHRRVSRQNIHPLPPAQRQPKSPQDRIVGIGKQYDEDREKRHATASSRQPQQDVLSPLQQIINSESKKQKAAIRPARQHAVARASKITSANATQQTGLETGTQPTQNAQAVADHTGTSSAPFHLEASSLSSHGQSTTGQATQRLHSAQKLKASSQPESRPRSQAKQSSQSAQQSQEPQHAQQPKEPQHAQQPQVRQQAPKEAADRLHVDQQSPAQKAMHPTASHQPAASDKRQTGKQQTALWQPLATAAAALHQEVHLPAVMATQPQAASLLRFQAAAASQALDAPLAGPVHTAKPQQNTLQQQPKTLQQPRAASRQPTAPPHASRLSSALQPVQILLGPPRLAAPAGAVTPSPLQAAQHQPVSAAAASACSSPKEAAGHEQLTGRGDQTLPPAGAVASVQLALSSVTQPAERQQQLPAELQQQLPAELQQQLPGVALSQQLREKLQKMDMSSSQSKEPPNAQRQAQQAQQAQQALLAPIVTPEPQARVTVAARLSGCSSEQLDEMLASIARLFSIEAQRHSLDSFFMLYAVKRFYNQWKDMPMASELFPFHSIPLLEVKQWRYLIVRYLDRLVAVQKHKQACEPDVLVKLSTYLIAESERVIQQNGLGLSIKDFMLQVGSFDPGLLAQWSKMPGNQKLASPQRRQDVPATNAATLPAIELLNSTVRTLPQQQPSVLAATQSSAAVPTGTTGGTLDAVPSHDLSRPSVSRLMRQVRERQIHPRLKVKGPTMPVLALPTAASPPIGTLGDGQPVRASQKGRQADTQTELPLSTQPELPSSAQPASLRQIQSGAVHSSPMNQIILNEPARSQTHLKSGPATELPQARKQNPQQSSEVAAAAAVHPLSPPRGSPLSPVHPLNSPRGSVLSLDSARRQWLLTDSFRQRQATCKEALKAAQQDVLKWLRTQRVAKYLPARRKPGCESCTSEALKQSLAKYQEKCGRSSKTDYYLGAVANLQLAVLLTECEDHMQTDSCSTVLQHLQYGLQQFATEGLDDPLQQPGHFDERLLMQEFYTALQAAAAVGESGLSSARRMSLSVSESAQAAAIASAQAEAHATPDVHKAAPGVSADANDSIHAQKAAFQAGGQGPAAKGALSAGRKQNLAAKDPSSEIAKATQGSTQAQQSAPEAERQEPSAAGAASQADKPTTPAAGQLAGAGQHAAADSSHGGPPQIAPQVGTEAGGPSASEGGPLQPGGRGVLIDPWGRVPLVLHRAKGKVSVALFSELTDADRGAAQTMQQLLQSSNNIYVNPAYESLCTHNAQESMQAAGLLQNHRQGKHQAWLLRLLENKSVVQAAAKAAFAQDQRCTAPLTSTNPVAPPSLAGARASEPTLAALAQNHSVAVNQAAASVTCSVLGDPVEAPSNTAAEAAPAEAAAAEAGNKHDLTALLAGSKQDLSDAQAHAHSSGSAAPTSAQHAGSRAPSKPTVEPAAADLKHAADTEACALDRPPAAAPASAEEPVGVAPSCQADQPASATASKKRNKPQSQPINEVFGSVSRNRKRAKAKKQKTDSLAAAAAAGAAAAVGCASSAHCPLGTEDMSESIIPNSSTAASNDTDMASAEAEAGSPDRSKYSQQPEVGTAHGKSSPPVDPATTHMDVSSDSHIGSRADGQHSVSAAEQPHVNAVVAQQPHHAAVVAQPSQQQQDHAQQQRSGIPSAAGAQAQQQRNRIHSTAGAKAAMQTAAAAAVGGGHRCLDPQQQGSGSDRGNARSGSLPDGDQPMGGGAGQGSDASGPADVEPEHDSHDEYAACTAGNIDRMLLRKIHLRGLYALEHELDARRKSLGQTNFNSVVLGSYFLAQSDPREDGDKGTKPAEECLHRIRAVHSCPVHGLVFETMHGERVPLCCLSDSATCSEAQVLLEQGRILKSSGPARLTRQEVAHADAAWRIRLCEQYFVIWDELQQPDLTPEQAGNLRARLEINAKETQSRPPQSVFDTIDSDYKTQEKSSRERLASLGIKIPSIPDSDNHPQILLVQAPAGPAPVPGPTNQSKQQNLDAAGEARPQAAAADEVMPQAACEGLPAVHNQSTSPDAQSSAQLGQSDLFEGDASGPDLAVRPVGEQPMAETQDDESAVLPLGGDAGPAGLSQSPMAPAGIAAIPRQPQARTAPSSLINLSGPAGAATDSHVLVAPGPAEAVPSSPALPGPSSLSTSPRTLPPSPTPATNMLRALHGSYASATPTPEPELPTTDALQKSQTAAAASVLVQDSSRLLDFSEQAKEHSERDADAHPLDTSQAAPPATSSSMPMPDQAPANPSDITTPSTSATASYAAAPQSSKAPLLGLSEQIPLPPLVLSPTRLLRPARTPEAVLSKPLPLTNAAVGEAARAAPAEHVEADTGCMVQAADTEAMERIMLWQITNLPEGGCATYLSGTSLFHRLTEHCIALSTAGETILTNVTIETIGWWGYVEFGTSAIKAQTNAASLVVEGYNIQLSVPTEPAPAYATAAQACPASTIEEAKRPQYIFASDAQPHADAAALAGPLQRQYPTYSYPAYGYNPGYGYSGYQYPAQWQPGQPWWDPVSQQYLYPHQAHYHALYPAPAQTPISAQTEASEQPPPGVEPEPSCEPTPELVRQGVPLAQPLAEPEMLHAPEINAQQVAAAIGIAGSLVKASVASPEPPCATPLKRKFIDSFQSDTATEPVPLPKSATTLSPKDTMPANQQQASPLLKDSASPKLRVASASKGTSLPKQHSSVGAQTAAGERLSIKLTRQAQMRRASAATSASASSAAAAVAAASDAGARSPAGVTGSVFTKPGKASSPDAGKSALTSTPQAAKFNTPAKPGSAKRETDASQNRTRSDPISQAGATEPVAARDSDEAKATEAAAAQPAAVSGLSTSSVVPSLAAAAELAEPSGTRPSKLPAKFTLNLTDTAGASESDLADGGSVTARGYPPQAEAETQLPQAVLGSVTGKTLPQAEGSAKGSVEVEGKILALPQDEGQEVTLPPLPTAASAAAEQAAASAVSQAAAPAAAAAAQATPLPSAAAEGAASAAPTRAEQAAPAAFPSASHPAAAQARQPDLLSSQLPAISWTAAKQDSGPAAKHRAPAALHVSAAGQPGPSDPRLAKKRQREESRNDMLQQASMSRKTSPSLQPGSLPFPFSPQLPGQLLGVTKPGQPAARSSSSSQQSHRGPDRDEQTPSGNTVESDSPAATRSASPAAAKLSQGRAVSGAALPGSDGTHGSGSPQGSSGPALPIGIAGPASPGPSNPAGPAPTQAHPWGMAEPPPPPPLRWGGARMGPRPPPFWGSAAPAPPPRSPWGHPRGKTPPSGPVGNAGLPHHSYRTNSHSRPGRASKSSRWGVSIPKQGSPSRPLSVSTGLPPPPPHPDPSNPTAAVVPSDGSNRIGAVAYPAQQQQSCAVTSGLFFPHFGSGNAQQAASEQDADNWFVPNPEASDECQAKVLQLRYRWGRSNGEDSGVKGVLNVKARKWSARRMGRLAFASGIRAQLAEAVLPQQLTVTKLGASFSPSLDKWQQRLKGYWAGSLIMFTAHQDPSESEASLASQLELARLSSMLRKSKQPLMASLPLSSSSSHDGAMPSNEPFRAGAQLWLIAPNSVSRKIVRDYLTEGAKGNVEQLLNTEDTSEMRQGRDRCNCNYILGLVFFSNT